MKHIRLLLFLFIVTVIAACATTDHDTNTLKEASTIKYSLPEAKAKIEVNLTLQSCNSKPVARAEVVITPVAIASSEDDYNFEITGSELKSFLKKRDVKVELHPHGAIKTINASVTDSSAAIIGGIIKLLTPLMGASNGVINSVCNKGTNDAIADRTNLQGKVTILRAKLASTTNKDDPDALVKQITALVQEIARLETGPLQLKLKKTIGFQKDVKGGNIKWSTGNFKKWVDASSDGLIDNFSLVYCVTPAKEDSTSCSVGEALPNKLMPDGITDDPNGGWTPASIPPPDCKPCTKTIVFREPVLARLILSTGRNGDFFGAKDPIGQDKRVASADLLIPQWGELSYLPLSVGFGGTKAVSLTLDEFGNKTAFGWTSGASGEGIVTGLSTVSDAVKSAKATIDGESLATQAKQITELETLQKLNKLENCRSILENGGFVCPEE